MIILVGKTCSGKSTIAEELEKKYFMPRIRTYTTRPKRGGESEEEYHFISEEEFKSLKENEFFFETTSYNVASGDTWYYGTSKDELINEKQKSCIIMNPDGVKKIHHMSIINPTIVYLNVTEGYQWSRLRARGCDADEAQRRVVADNKDFADIDKYYDFAITTDNFSPSEIASLIIKLDYFKH